MDDPSKCQYCFVHYNECTCCQYCSFPKGTCDCHLEGEWPCTKFHPADTYKYFNKDLETCYAFVGIESLEDCDKYIMKMFTKDVWPERLKK
jgi:hypothetical protein